MDAAALGGEKVRPGDDEDEQRILLETGGDDGDSSKMFDLFPHTTADMFRSHKEMFSISLQSLCQHFNHADSTKIIHREMKFSENNLIRSIQWS